MADIDRRHFLSGSGALFAGALAAKHHPTPRPLQPDDWQSVRDQFALDPDIAHFAAYVLASPPKPVRDAIERHRRGLDADTSGYLEQLSDTPVRRAAAGYLGARPDEIALTGSTTAGLGIVYGGLDLQPGDDVLTTEHDFFSTHEALRRAAHRTGATVNRVRLYDDPSAADVGEIVERLVEGITPQTRAIAITWVHSSTGVKLPIRVIADAIAEHNDRGSSTQPVLLVVDGIHGLGVENVTVGELGCDVLVSGTHKWLWGPRGTGIVWAKETAWASIAGETPPFEQVHFDAWLDNTEPARVRGGLANTPGGYAAFEHRAALVEAFQFHGFIGKAAIAERTHSQATQLKEGLVDIDGLRTVTPMSTDLSSGMVCVAIPEPHLFEVMEQLRNERFSTSITPYIEHFMRIGPSIVTSPAQVDDLLSALRRLVKP